MAADLQVGFVGAEFAAYTRSISPEDDLRVCSYVQSFGSPGRNGEGKRITMVLVMTEAELNVHNMIGGLPTFEKLVDHFYDAVEQDPLLRPMYPEDLTDSRRHLALFLSQFFGGPPEYSIMRGHPRLRARHLPFVIGPKERNAWVRHMLAAVDLTGIQEPGKSHLTRYFEEAATFMINQ